MTMNHSQRSTTRTEERIATDEFPSAVVLKDQAGDYYLLSRDVLARARATEAQRAEIDRMITDEDVSGFDTPTERWMNGVCFVSGAGVGFWPVGTLVFGPTALGCLVYYATK
jgi:hypothetical protein